MPHPAVRRILVRLGSLKLALAGLGLLMALIFIGTLAQVPLGTYEAQKKFFDSFWVFWDGPGYRLPVFPGGLAIGALLMVNLVSAYALRFPFPKKQAGVVVLHLGLIVMFGGQFFTQLLSTESHMPIEIGQTLNYSENSRHMELAIIDASDPAHDDVTAIPDRVLARKNEIALPGKSFSIRVLDYFMNAELRMLAPGEVSAATQGVGQRIFAARRPPIATDDQPNNTSALIEVLENGRSLGVWLVSYGLGAPQSFFAGGREYSISVRPIRYYYPFSLHLKEFKHDRYPGTDIPKNFSSLVHLHDFERGESRDALIYMNHPLRYRGLTFYQASFGKEDTLSVFQVVRNPAWLTPYISCALVVLGMLMHFFRRLSGFLKRKNEVTSR